MLVSQDRNEDNDGCGCRRWSEAETGNSCLLRRESRELWSRFSTFVAVINNLQKYLACLKHPNCWKSASPESLSLALGVVLGHKAPQLAHHSPGSQASPAGLPAPSPCPDVCNTRRSIWHPEGYSQAVKICG